MQSNGNGTEVWEKGIQVDLAAQAVGELLRDAGEDPRLEEAARRADQVQHQRRRDDAGDGIRGHDSPSAGNGADSSGQIE